MELEGDGDGLEGSGVEGGDDKTACDCAPVILIDIALELA